MALDEHLLPRAARLRDRGRRQRGRACRRHRSQHRRRPLPHAGVCSDRRGTAPSPPRASTARAGTASAVRQGRGRIPKDASPSGPRGPRTSSAWGGCRRRGACASRGRATRRYLCRRCLCPASRRCGGELYGTAVEFFRGGRATGRVFRAALAAWLDKAARRRGRRRAPRVVFAADRPLAGPARRRRRAGGIGGATCVTHCATPEEEAEPPAPSNNPLEPPPAPALRRRRPRPRPSMYAGAGSYYANPTSPADSRAPLVPEVLGRASADAEMALGLLGLVVVVLLVVGVGLGLGGVVARYEGTPRRRRARTPVVAMALSAKAKAAAGSGKGQGRGGAGAESSRSAVAASSAYRRAKAQYILTDLDKRMAAWRARPCGGRATATTRCHLLRSGRPWRRPPRGRRGAGRQTTRRSPRPARRRRPRRTSRRRRPKWFPSAGAGRGAAAVADALDASRGRRSGRTDLPTSSTRRAAKLPDERSATARRRPCSPEAAAARGTEPGSRRRRLRARPGPRLRVAAAAAPELTPSASRLGATLATVSNNSACAPTVPSGPRAGAQWRRRPRPRRAGPARAAEVRRWLRPGGRAGGARPRWARARARQCWRGRVCKCIRFWQPRRRRRCGSVI